MNSENTKLEKLLRGEADNHIFPFFWQHGEAEEVLREYMRVIYEANIRAVCIESRPHPDFAGEGWWHDMDIILDEARTRKMKVWILDDSHFPTGYCNGAVENKPDACRRWFLTYRILGEVRSTERRTWDREEYAKAEPFEPSRIEKYFHMNPQTLPGDQWLGAVAVRKGGTGERDLVTLEETGGKITFAPQEGAWKVYALQLTRNRGPHRNYMNMLDEESCHTLIEAVYEPHYAHYHEDFGKTIAGFFSDEPEIGNGHLYEMDRKIYEVSDQPWSRSLQRDLQEIWGAEYVKYLPLLWEREFGKSLTAKVRYVYMDRVTRRVEKDFSRQLGDWCAEHDVEYIGHLIEDNNQHARCGSSLGHYFRGLAGQHMAGIDDIGGQVLPQGEDISYVSHLGTPRDGAFYHFTLGRLASSAAAIDARKQNRSMCEIFGNYGWSEGVRLEAYLADHFMVRGVNHYVPHAFSAKAFPDPDCPPHFYAHGHNPQYRHFGVLMKYMNRVCSLISGGYHESEAAILYPGEAEWTGMTAMYLQEPARVLTEAQIGFDFIPSDVFTDDCYQASLENGLQIGAQSYRCLVIPETDYVTREAAEAIVKLGQQGFPCLFLNGFPKGICSWGAEEKETTLLAEMRANAQVVPLDELAATLQRQGWNELRLEPAEQFLRTYHYYADEEILYLVNEGTEPYEGKVLLERKTGRQKAGGEKHGCVRYDAWENRLRPVNYSENSKGMEIQIRVEPGKSWILVLNAGEETETLAGNGCCRYSRKEEQSNMYSAGVTPGQESAHTEEKVLLDGVWTRTQCRAIDYPAFGNAVQTTLPDHAEKELPEFGGVLRYERELVLQKESKDAVLEITDAGEAVQLFVNGTDCGIQIVPPFRYEVGALLKEGSNRIAIEVATTLERQIPPKRKPDNWQPQNPIGLCGEVYHRVTVQSQAYLHK